MHDLTFRVTGPQRRALLIRAAQVAAVAAVLGVVAIVAPSRLGVPAADLAAGLGLGALVIFYAWAAYATSYTECTPTGIRTRGLGGRRGCPWSEVSSAYVMGYTGSRLVVVRTVSGKRFWLGAPIDSSLVRDPDFAEKAQQIMDYQRKAVLGRLSDHEGAAPPSADESAARPSSDPVQLSDRDRRGLDIPWKAPAEWPEDPHGRRADPQEP
jgi:hypothetical protein